MGTRTGLLTVIGVLALIGVAWVWASLPAHVFSPAREVPTFTTDSRPTGPAPASRTTLLPTDCAEVLAGSVDASALLARPSGSVAVKGVLGVPAPSVDLLERMSCQYQQPGGRPGQLLTVGLAAFTDERAADEQRLRNVAAERSTARAVTPVTLGAAQATLLTEAGQSRLMVSYDRYTVTATIGSGVVADPQAGPILVDLVRRVLPNLEPPGSRTAAAPVPASPH